MPGFLVIALVLIAVGLLVVGGVVATRSRRASTDRSPQSAAPTAPAAPAAPAAPTADAAASPVTKADAYPAQPATPDDVLVGLEPVEVAEFERPEPAAGRLRRLRGKLARSQSTLGRGLLSLLSRDKLDDQTWEDIEDTLLAADVGVAPAQELVERLRARVRVEGVSGEQAHALLREELLTLLGPDFDRTLHADRTGVQPAVVLVVGVNGVGKTTTVGKIARVLVAEDKDVILAAADTFRAAAADQLTTWGDRVGVPTVRGPEGSDPASVAFEAAKAGVEQEVDTVIIDTAGRLHTKVGLMDELGKVKRVVERQAPVTEVLLVIDATTGQNGLTQARVFAEVVAVTGIVLTKLDGTAKGGIVIAVQRELGVPVKLVGLGEGPDDLAPFDPEAFVDALLDA